MNNEIIISNVNPQDIFIGEGGASGITDVLVNGSSVVENNIAYVVVPTKLSELQNDTHFISQETDPTVPYVVKQITLGDINRWNSKQEQLISGVNIKTINNNSILGEGNINVDKTYTAGTGINITSENVINNTITSYNDLDDLPTIPTKISDLQNDSDFVESSELSNVAFSGSYLDLSNTPDLSLYATLDTNELLNYYTKDFFFKILPKVSGSGTSITLNDTVDNAQMYLTLGASELSQDGTPTPDSPQDIHTISGSNKVVVYGKNLFDGLWTNGISDNFIKVNKNVNYKYSEQNQAESVNIRFYESTSGNYTQTYVSATSYYTPSEDGYIKLYKTTTSGIECQLEIGTTTTSYEPYVSQEADIDLGNIEYCKIGNYEDKFIRTSGENLFDESQLLEATGWAKNSNGYYTGLASDLKAKYGTTTDGFTFANTFKENTQYTISCNFYSSVNNGNNRFYFEYTDGTSSIEAWNDTSPTNKSVTSTAGKTIRKICFDCNINATTIYFKNLMLNEGTTALEYEPYGTNEWYIKKNIGKVDLGSLNWSYFSTEPTFMYNLNLPVYSNTQNTLCEVYPYSQAGTNKCYRFNANILRIYDSDYNDTTTFQNAMSGKMLYYQLATPTYTLITGTLETQLENVYQKMLSQKGQTNISQVNNDLPFVISAVTLKDMSNL